MSAGTSVVPPAPPLFDEARLAIAGFLARYSGATRKSYATYLRQYFAWCAQVSSTSCPRAGPLRALGWDHGDRGLSR